MKVEPRRPHRFDIAPYEAQQIQRDLARQVVSEDDLGDIATIAGIEIGHSRFDDRIQVAVAILSHPDLVLIEQVVIEHRTKFPFVPDLLSFREVPAILQALGELTRMPDLFLIDGPGLAHPKGLGVASHLGVVLDLPSIGCSKVNAVGSFVQPEVNAGSSTSLVWQGEIIGTVFRSKNRVAPLFISSGHRIARDTAARVVKDCCHGYRLPEPTRIASGLLSEAKQTAREATAGVEN
ncbi:MAG: deoxyribonuclease V [Candidatus Sericytochromatia bacterium]|uniref:Endonuclease V n=1 Tax=Candidatus Tanganyikabacteria bacterium TaxID=2961651 RepID=A0A938BMX7_9BACT|nr:deoxyribonuclease V [Candidatus Tanganyikabacteria bacterium]